MFSIRSASIAVVVALAALASTEARAWGYHQRWHRATSCYQKVARPATYTTMARQVMLKPGWWELRTLPAEYRQEHYRTLVQAERTSFEATSAVYETVAATAVVRRGYSTWVRKTGHGYREVMCKVEVPAEIATLYKKVLVSHGSRVARRQPAVYATATRSVLVRGGRKSRVYHPPVHGVVSERVLVSPGSYGWRRLAPGC